MQKDIIESLLQIQSDLWRSATDNDTDLFQETMDRFSDLVDDLQAQEPSAASDGESVAVLEGVEYETHFNAIQNTVVLIRRA